MLLLDKLRSIILDVHKYQCLALISINVYDAPAGSKATPYRAVGTQWSVEGLAFSARYFVAFSHPSCDQLPDNGKYGEYGKCTRADSDFLVGQT